MFLTKIALAVGLIFGLTGCACKPTVEFVEADCVKIDLITQPKERTIRVHRDDRLLYEMYVLEFRGKIKTSNDVISKHNTQCEKE